MEAATSPRVPASIWVATIASISSRSLRALGGGEGGGSVRWTGATVSSGVGDLMTGDRVTGAGLGLTTTARGLVAGVTRVSSMSGPLLELNHQKVPPTIANKTAPPAINPR